MLLLGVQMDKKGIYEDKFWKVQSLKQILRSISYQIDGIDVK